MKHICPNKAATAENLVGCYAYVRILQSTELYAMEWLRAHMNDITDMRSGIPGLYRPTLCRQ